MKYKIVLLVLLSLSFLFAFKAEVKITPRKVLLEQLDSLEMVIQQKRRSGESIKSIEEEIAKLKWTIEESKSDTTEVSDSLIKSIVIKDPVKDTLSSEKNKSSVQESFSHFIKTHSTLDIMIIVTGCIAALSIVLLTLFLLYLKFFKSGTQPQKRKEPKKSQKEKSTVTKKGVNPTVSAKTLAEKKDALEDIKSKLMALNNRKDKEAFIERIEQSEVASNLLKGNRELEDSFENPFQNRVISRKSSEEALQSPFSDEAPVVPKVVSMPVVKSVDEPLLSPEQEKLEEKLEQQRAATLTKPHKLEEVEEQYLSINDSIIAAFDSGEDLVSIAKRMQMSIDQIKMILRISGR